MAFGMPLKNPTDTITDTKDMMDATPIDEVLSPEEMQGPPPTMMPTQIPAAHGAMMHPQQQAPQQQASQQTSQNPMNMTDEQMQALMVAVAASIAFSDPVQAKLGSAIPNFLVDGERSMTGLAISGLAAAGLFYFTKRFMTR